MTDANILELQYRAEITEALAAKYCRGIDTLDWSLFASIFDEEFDIDFSHALLAHVPGPKRMKRSEWIDFCGIMNGFDASQHYMTNHRFEFKGHRATVRVYLQAEHHLGTDSNTLGGEYTFDMQRTAGDWRIYKYSLKPMWTRGSQIVFEIAAERIRTGRDCRKSIG